MPIPKASFPADPHVLTLFQEELARAAGTSGLAPPAPALWPRFAEYYRGLARLPRRLRRALERRWRRSLGGLALLCALGQAPALAATISVGEGCTLIDAITAANSDTPSGVCSAGSGADTINLPFQSTHTLTTVNNNTDGPTGLPVITSQITIDGGFGTITRDSTAPRFRILAVGATGNLTLKATSVTGGESFVGGGIRNDGTLTLFVSFVSNNRANAFYGGAFGSGDGGGIDNSGTLTLTNSRVDNNSASFDGGGINNSGTVTLTNSTVSGNSAFGGGGIENYSGTVTLTNSTVSGNSARGIGGGIQNSYLTPFIGTVTLTNSTVSGNTAGDRGAGVENGGYLTLTNSTISGNTLFGCNCFNGGDGSGGGGIRNESFGDVTLTNSTVLDNLAHTSGGGVLNVASLTLASSTVNGNSAGTRGGGLSNYGLLTLTNSTVSGNTAGDRGGGVGNTETVTLANSTVSGNTATDRGGGVENTGTVTLTNSTVTANASGRVAGGLFNTGTVTLVQSLLSGNTAPVNGPEAYSGSGIVVGDSFNIFGHDSFSGVTGFALGATDLVPAVPLSAILDATLSYNGGPTRTHGLVFGSPAIDTIPGVACATGADQRGALRPQDADGDTFADCDSGAVERGLIPIQAEITNTTLDCNSAACRVSVRCNLLETQCINPIDVAVRTRATRASDGTLVKASKLIRFAAGVTNVPPGGTQQLRVKLTKPGKRLVRATKKRRLKGVLGIQEIAATVSNTPVTISRTDVAIRLKRRK